MRIISGVARGRKLKRPRGDKTRPTSDRVREALFNILTPFLEGSNFLDLFAGTGAIGIEALSRGVPSVVFIDNDSMALKVINENLQLSGFRGFAETYKQDALVALEILAKKNKKFDIIYVDPPYAAGYYKKVLDTISSGNLLSQKGIIVLETDKRELLPPQKDSLKIIRQEKYGNTALVFYRSINEENGFEGSKDEN